MMTAGISTACFYPMNTEDALAILAGRGVRATEIFLNSNSELDRDYLLRLRAIADSAGMHILSVHPFTSGMEPMLFFSDYDRRFEDGREYYRRYYQAARLLGAEIVVFHGNTAQFRMQAQDYCHRFAALMSDAKEAGVTLCHENVSRCTSRSPEFFREMTRLLPTARYVLDVKQAVRAGEDVFEFLEAMGSHIAHVHISDHSEEQDCLSVGKGTFNIEEFLSCLRARGVDGGVIVELYRNNFRDIVELMDGYQQLSRQIAKISTTT